MRRTLTRRFVLGASAGLMTFPAQAAPGRIITVAGTGAQGFAADGESVKTAKLDQPFGVLFGPDGALIWTEFGSNRILRLRAGKISVVAGTGAKGHAGDGAPARQAELSTPHEVRFDSKGNMYVAERDTHVIRFVDAKSGAISTLAGTGVPGFTGDGGPSAQALLRQPHSIVLDRADNLYICDIGNNRIRRRDAASGIITTFAGNGETADTPDEAPLTAPLRGPRSIDIGPDGTMYLILREGNKIYSLDPARKTSQTHRRHRRQRLWRRWRPGAGLHLERAQRHRLCARRQPVCFRYREPCDPPGLAVGRHRIHGGGDRHARRRSGRRPATLRAGAAAWRHCP